jgi:hypothetical protein
MALKIITISDGFESSVVPSIILPSVQSTTTIFISATSTQLISGNINLPSLPLKPAETQLIWIGIGQTYGLDYSVSGTILTLLSNLLPKMSISDSLTIVYS